jgi:hypothetical protein
VIEHLLQRPGATNDLRLSLGLAKRLGNELALGGADGKRAGPDLFELWQQALDARRQDVSPERLKEQGECLSRSRPDENSVDRLVTFHI